MNIVDALEKLKVEGLEGAHDHIIETVLSKLFVRGDEVHKAYKHRTADFADLADPEVRRSYIAEDFFWNNAMAPDVYLSLREVKREGDRFVHTESGTGEDWYIMMRKIDTSRDLMRRIASNTLRREELAGYVRTLLDRLRALTQSQAPRLREFFDKGASHVHSEVLGATEWAAVDGEPYLTPKEVARARERIAAVLERESYFTDPINLSVVIDTNPENILFLDGGVSFIDVMPPKDAWRVHDPYFALSRTSADIGALLGVEHTAILNEIYAEYAELPPRRVQMVYELAAALIQVPYRKMLGQGELAAKYADYVRQCSDELEMLLLVDDAGFEPATPAM